MSRHLAIVPAFNEAGTIAQTVGEIHEHAPGFDVLVVDDGSGDATAAIAAAAGARVVSLPFNVGIGGAMQCGYLYARDNGYSVAVQVDGDGQHDARDIPRMLAALTADAGVEMVTGSRFLERGGYRSSPMRLVGIRVFAALMSLITRQRVTDATSGFRMSARRGDRAVRPRLPARLSRGRGDPAAARPQAANARDPGGDAPAHERALGDRARGPRLLHGQGPARRAGRPDARAPGPRGPGAAAMIAAAASKASVSPTLTRVAVITIAVLVALVVVELVRRRRMMERYALLWLAAALTLLVLAIWKGLLTTLSADVGIKAPTNALFAVGFGFVVVLLLSISLAISRISDQNKQLAQRVALLTDRLAALEKQDSPEP